MAVPGAAHRPGEDERHRRGGTRACELCWGHELGRGALSCSCELQNWRCCLGQPCGSDGHLTVADGHCHEVRQRAKTSTSAVKLAFMLVLLLGSFGRGGAPVRLPEQWGRLVPMGWILADVWPCTQETAH
jgi:hypothetical protein